MERAGFFRARRQALAARHRFTNPPAGLLSHDYIAGVPRDPVNTPSHLARYAIPSGSPCRIKREESSEDWRDFTTRIDLNFIDAFYSTPGLLVFQWQGWLLKIDRCHVRDVERGETPDCVHTKGEP